MTNSVTAAIAGALISGVAMYTVGARTATVDAFATPTAPVTLTASAAQPVSAQPVAAAQPVRLRPAATARPVVYREARAPRVVQSAPQRVYAEDARPQRSWQKSALIIGGSAASGAGVGAIVGGKKGALIGAALGGGASSIYEATRRR